MIRAKADVAPVAALPSPSLTGKDRRSVWMFAAVMILLIGTTAFFGWRYFGSSNKAVAVSTPEIGFKRLTPDADATAPSISPDGASVAFVKNENRQRSLWRRTIALGEMTQLLLPASALDGGEISLTRFTPDGKWIYYKLENSVETNIFRIPAYGGTPQLIIKNVITDFSISPNGKQIAFTRDFRQLVVADVETGAEPVVAERDGVKKVVHSFIYSSGRVVAGRFAPRLFGGRLARRRKSKFLPSCRN